MVQQAKLQITIDNKEDVELFEFASSMASLNSQYHRFVNQSKDKKLSNDCKLYVNRVAEGSIVIDLCEKAPEVLPAIMPLIAEYSTFLIKTLKYLSGKAPGLPSNYRFTKEDFNNFTKLLTPVANITGNTLNFKCFDESSTIIINQTFNHTEANAAQNKCSKEIERLTRAGESLIKEKVQLSLYQARNSVLSSSHSGNLGIIEEISEKPTVISFANDRLRHDITKAESNPFNFVYSVDVEIKLREGSMFFESAKDIKEYEILKLHGPIEKADLFSTS